MKNEDFKIIQKAISFVFDTFSKKIEEKLDLLKISGPIIMDPKDNLNDNLTGNNKSVKFTVPFLNRDLEIVQSLAKWKRMVLWNYKFDAYKGIYVNMNAIRPCEITDDLHSLYVDQWDWEKVIKKSDRNIDFLKKIVKQIYKCLYETENEVNKKFSGLKLNKKLPKTITFFNSQEIEDKYGNDDFDAITNDLAKKHGAIFISQIGNKLKSGKVFDSRSFEYDDWMLNGDLFVYSKAIGKTIEISSMGIRVDKSSLINQGKIDGNKNIESNYHKLIIENKLPYTIGGGIGKSRVAMFLLEKKHIGQVQSSVWDEKTKNESKTKKISILV